MRRRFNVASFEISMVCFIFSGMFKSGTKSECPKDMACSVFPQFRLGAVSVYVEAIIS